MQRLHYWIAGLALCLGLAQNVETQAGERWTESRANAWYQETGWLVGCNFMPSSAINQLEMWQADTFDEATIDRELGWAEQIGFNSVRVFLHDIPWKQDRDGFVKRIRRFLDIAERHHIGVMFVIFDSCWDPFPQPGKQRAPKPHVHNSGWVQSPGQLILKDPSRHDELKEYVQDILRTFGKDRRIHFWDLFNEPDNPNASSYGKVELTNKAEMGFALLQKTFAWAREVDPKQPISAGVWAGDWKEGKLSPINRLMLEQSDIITFHNYSDANDLKERITDLRRYHRPVLCTEYMARPAKSTFEPNLRIMRQQNVSAYNWGFVDGKSQTIYPWDSWTKTYTAAPPLWFHDIFRRDGQPYIPAEVEFIKSVTGRK